MTELKGLKGLAEFLGISERSVNRYKRDGIFPPPLRYENSAAGPIVGVWDSTQIEHLRGKILKPAGRPAVHTPTAKNCHKSGS